jgi:hypothetical protein
MGDTDFVLDYKGGRKGANILKRILDTKQADPRAIRAVMNLCNPFPDDAVTPTGWPDKRSTPSCVMVDTQIFDVRKPSAAGFTAATWNFQVCNFPIAQSTDGYLVEMNPDTGLLTGVASPACSNVGLFNITASNDPENIPLWHPTSVNYISTIASTSVRDLLEKCPSRPVAMGFEVIDVTPELYRGGTCTVYRVPADKAPLMIETNPSASLARCCANYTFAPISPKDVINYSTTKVWGAEDGCYVINTPAQATNPTSHTLPCQMLLGNSAGDDPTLNLTTACSNIMWDWNMAGAFFTDLQPQAVFRVTVKTYLEVFPTISSNEPSILLRLARPPVPWSPILDEIISGVLADMPAGCKVDENPLGEWFTKVLDTVKNWAPTIGNALGTFVPGASMIGQGLGAAAGAGAHFLKESQAKKKEKKEKKQMLAKQAEYEANRGRAALAKSSSPKQPLLLLKAPPAKAKGAAAKKTGGARSTSVPPIPRGK